MPEDSKENAVSIISLHFHTDELVLCPQWFYITTQSANIIFTFVINHILFKPDTILISQAHLIFCELFALQSFSVCRAANEYSNRLFLSYLLFLTATDAVHFDTAKERCLET